MLRIRNRSADVSFKQSRGGRVELLFAPGVSPGARKARLEHGIGRMAQDWCRDGARSAQEWRRNGAGMAQNGVPEFETGVRSQQRESTIKSDAASFDTNEIAHPLNQNNINRKLLDNRQIPGHAVSKESPSTLHKYFLTSSTQRMTSREDVRRSYERDVWPGGSNALLQSKRVGRRGKELCVPCRKAKRGYDVPN